MFRSFCKYHNPEQKYFKAAVVRYKSIIYPYIFPADLYEKVVWLQQFLKRLLI